MVEVNTVLGMLGFNGGKKIIKNGEKTFFSFFKWLQLGLFSKQEVGGKKSFKRGEASEGSG